MLVLPERRVGSAACRCLCSALSIIVLLNNIDYFDYFTVMHFVCVEMVRFSVMLRCLLDFIIFDSHVE